MTNPDKPLVRLVDDDADLLAAQAQALRIAGFQAEPFDSAIRALEALSPHYPGVVLSDVRMPGMDGFAFHRRVQALDADLPVILLTGHGDVPMAVAALKAGAWDFLTKPVGVDVLIAALRRATSARALVLENRLLRASRIEETPDDPRLSGTSPAITHLRNTIARVAEAGVDALIAGPVGVGKESVARALHAQGSRRARPFVHVICAALDPARFDSDFFGQPAISPRGPRLPGLLEKAHRGTLFLDGIDTLTEPVQARLLAILGMGEFTPAGGAGPRPLECRIIASTATDLSALARSATFRADLLYRLSGVVISVPPLAARREDLPHLFRRFLLTACRRLNMPVPTLSAHVQARLLTHHWPGNLRELQQFAESAVFGLSAPAMAEVGDGPAESLSDQLAAYEKELIRAALHAAQGSVTQAQERLGLPRKTLYDKMARHTLDPSSFRPQQRKR